MSSYVEFLNTTSAHMLPLLGMAAGCLILFVLGYKKKICCRNKTRSPTAHAVDDEPEDIEYGEDPARSTSSIYSAESLITMDQESDDGCCVASPPRDHLIWEV